MAENLMMAKFFSVTKAELITHAYHSVVTEMTAAVAMKQLCVRGYHVYKNVWAAVVGEELVWRKRNSHDVYAVSVMKDSVVIGHLPRKISPVASLFLLKDGMILCRLLRRRHQCRALEHTCLEVFRIFSVI